MWWFWRLEDELMVVGRGNAAFGGSAESGECIARERHGPAQTTTCGNGAGQWHNAPGHADGKAQLLAFHHIKGAIERNDNLALMFEGITGRAFAVRLTIRRGGRFLFRSMSTATAAAGAGLGTIASARLSRVGTNIVRHGNSNRLGKQLGRRKLLGRIDVLEAERRARGLNDLRFIHITSLNAIDQAANALAVADEQLLGN